MSEQAKWEDSDSGAIVMVIAEGKFLVDKGFSVGREVRMADAEYLNTLEAQAALAGELVAALIGIIEEPDGSTDESAWHTAGAALDHARKLGVAAQEVSYECE
mgnify:CR=1 FL=1